MFTSSAPLIPNLEIRHHFSHFNILKFGTPLQLIYTWNEVGFFTSPQKSTIKLMVFLKSIVLL